MSLPKPTVADFRQRHKMFTSDADYPDADIQIYIDEACLEISCCAFGAYYPKAVMLHAAHFLALETAANAQYDVVGQEGINSAVASVGGINSASVGDVSISQNLVTPGENDAYGTYHATMFGQQLIRLIKKMGKGAMVASTARNTEACAPEAPGVCI